MGKRICIVGAGPGGLCGLKQCLEMPDWKVTVFERAGQLGGVWRFSDKKGKEGCSEKFPTPMYSNLRTNTPKFMTQFTDHPWPEGTPLFPSKDDVLKYIQSYTDCFGLSPYLRFNQEVVLISPIDLTNRENPGWNVQVKCHETNKIQNFEFDKILLCSGENMVHTKPSIPNMSEFKGHVITADNYLDNSSYVGKRVVLLGGSVTAVDLCVHISKVAKEVILSRKTPTIVSPMKFPSNVKQVEPIERATTDGFVLKNGEILTNVDAIVFCTGYYYDYKFLAPECGISVDKGKRINTIYRHSINVKFPSMAFACVCSATPFFYFASMQIKWIIKCLAGSIQLPNLEGMLADVQADQDKRKSMGFDEIHFAHHMAYLQWDYFDQLSKEAEIEQLPYVRPAFEFLFGRSFGDSEHFRNDEYIFRDHQNVECRACS